MVPSFSFWYPRQALISGYGTLGRPRVFPLSPTRVNVRIKEMIELGTLARHLMMYRRGISG